jgi:FkbM family methyltransferase
MMLEKIKRIYRQFFRNQPKYKITYKTKTERHGTVYGGWNIIPNSLNGDSIVYSFGLGEDISFDLSIIKKYGCLVHGFDPTPQVTEWLKTQDLTDKFKFHPIGLSHEDGILTFYAPVSDDLFSHTIIPKSNSVAVEVPCQKIKTIAESLKHDHIDLLKMDIEGFEYKVLENLFISKIRPKQILVEFHHFFPEIGNEPTEKMIQKLEENGYHLYNVADSFCEYSFILIV